MVKVEKVAGGKWFEDKYNLKDIVALSFAVHRINNGYLRKDFFAVKDDNDIDTQLPNLFIINNALGIEKFKTKSINDSLKKYYTPVEVTDEDREQVDSLVKYFKGLALKVLKREISDFEKTILGIINKEFVEYKDIGVLASLPHVFTNGQKQKDFNKLEKQMASQSDFAGVLHERGSFHLEVLHKKYIWRTSSNLFVTKDVNNNIVKFFSDSVNAEVGDNIHITGYVKDHTIGKISNGKETFLNRIKTAE
jgi:hypothetical protein